MTLNAESIYSLDPLRKNDDDLWLGECRKQHAADQSKKKKKGKQKARVHTPGTSTSTMEEMGNLSHSRKLRKMNIECI